MNKDDNMKPYAIRFSDSEIAAVRDITKVDAVAPAVRSIVLKAIEDSSRRPVHGASLNLSRG